MSLQLCSTPHLSVTTTTTTTTTITDTGSYLPIYPQVPCRYPIDGNRNFITNAMQNA
jgi:hypothetical protein